ncbi:MAG: hypothetical protein ACOQNV_02030 [Mycoplasmoidaceae bacterium]
MKKTKKVKTLGKPERTKLPLRKFLNKFFVYNIFLTIGVAMLICSLACTSVFGNDIGKIIGNIVVSILVLLAGLAGGLTYSLLLTYRGEEPLEQTFSKLTRWFFWVPILGIVFDKIWKHKELKMNYAIKLSEHPEFKKPKMFLPSSMVIIFAALVGAVFLIWILYIAGVIVPDASKGQVIPGLIDIFLNPLRGFAGYTTTEVIGFTPGDDPQPIFRTINGVAGIAIFLLLFNGTMTLVNDAKAIEAGIGALLKKMNGKEIILIPILMFILAICGSTFNMCEQLLPLFLVVIPIMFAAGFDAMTGFILVFCSAGVGVMGSTVNPVLVGIATSAIPAEFGVKMMDGIVWRLIMFIALTLTSILCTVFYARKVKKNPQKSCVYMSDSDFKNKYSFDKDALPPMTKKRKWTLIVFGIVFLLLIVGLIDWKAITGWNGFQQLHDWLGNCFPFLSSIAPIGSWGMVEAGMLFFIGSVIIGVINWQGCGHFIGTWVKGCGDFVPVAFILAVGKGLAITLTDSGLNNVIANGLGEAIKVMPAVGAMFMIFIVIALLTIFIPSSSGLSSAMMPMIGQAVGSVGAGTITLSGSVTTFAAAMGWMNIITPAGMLLPFLEVSKMDMTDYFKGAWKQLAILLVVGLALLSIGTIMPAEMKLF